MKSHYSVIVAGAGPAGMAAACCIAEHAVDVALLDEQDRPGGQIYRRVGDSPLPDAGLLGDDYLHGRRITEAMLNSSADYIPGAAVWNIGGNREVCALIAGKSRVITGDRIIIATGAQERPMPFPGWQLPGVMTAGAGQILLKSAAMVPSAGVVLAGSGPLLLLLACQYLRAGVHVQALVDTTPGGNRNAAVRHLAGALKTPSYLAKGMRLLYEIRRGGVPVYPEAGGLRARGGDFLDSVAFRSRGRDVELETRTLMLHQGVIPQLHLTMAAGCDVRWDDGQHCWRPVCDRWGESTMPGISLAGDGAGIVGAAASELQGRLVALQCLHGLGVLDARGRDGLASPLSRRYMRHVAIRPFLDTLYRPAVEFLAPPDETVVCRCEEVTAGEIREVARLGCTGPNQAKAFTRCGMGPCQGRQCGGTVAALIAEVQGRALPDVGCLRVRPPVRPVTLAQMGGTGPVNRPW